MSNSIYFSSPLDEQACSNTNSVSTESPKQLTYCFFNSERDKVPKSKTVAWTQLCKSLSKHVERNTKSGQCFSAVSYAAGSTRSSDGVREFSAAILDVDDGFPVERMRKQLDGFAYMLYTSWSHTAERHKYRVVLPFESPVPAKNWPEIWERLNLFALGHLDQATKDRGRIYFAPIKPRGSPDHFVVIGEGEFLSVDALPHPLNKPTLELVESKHTSTATTEFEQANEIALERIDEFIDWLGLEGEFRGKQFVALNPKRNDHSLGSFTINTDDGRWADFAIDKTGGDLVSLVAYLQDVSQFDARRKVQEKFQSPSLVGLAPARVLDSTESQRDLPSENRPSFAHSEKARNPEKQPKPTTEKNAEKKLVDFVRDFVDLHFSDGLVYSNESFLGYTEGYWPKLDERVDIRHQVVLHCGSKANPKCTAAYVQMLKDLYPVRNFGNIDGPRLICLSNGTLDPETGILHPHSPEHGLRTKLNIPWDPKAPRIRFEQFLDEIFRDDPDKAEKIEVLQQWFGYCLVADSSMHKFIWLIGEGGNGKSVLLFAIEKLLGADNVSHAFVSRFEDPTVRAELEGKLLNISSEMGADATIGENFKAIVSGDSIEARKLYQPSISFRPYCRIICSTNDLPRLLDLSGGFQRRAIILRFNRQFRGAEVDTKLTSKIETELPGILAWAVEGLKKLRTQGHFTIPASSEAELAQYRLEADSVQMFLAEHQLEPTRAGTGMAPRTLFENYLEWCKAGNFVPVNKANFGRRLRRLGIEKRKSNGQEYWMVEKRGVLRAVDSMESNVSSIASRYVL